MAETAMSSESPSLDRLRQLPLAVVDLETTGISPHLHDRVLEVAVVRLRPDPPGTWQIAEEFVTLVNPGRDVGVTWLHGISASEVHSAPVFAEVAGDIAARLDGAVVAAHNLQFDLGFLAAEFGRVGLRLPELPALCTLRLAHAVYPRLPSRKLGHLCEVAGIQHEDCHAALDDARATAHLLVHLIDELERNGCGMDGCGHLWRLPLRAAAWAPPPTGRVATRAMAAERLREERTYLARLVERLAPASERQAPSAVEYLAVLDRALEDRLVTREEAEGLFAFASAAGLSRSEVLELHRGYLARLVGAALYDGIVSDSEHRDLEFVCDLLDLHRAALHEMLSSASGAATRPPPPEGLQGKTICFTGQFLCRYQGEPITRELAQRLAAEAGLVIAETVTKRLDLLVVADPHTSSGKAVKARRYGTRILAEAAFWQAIGVRVE